MIEGPSTSEIAGAAIAKLIEDSFNKIIDSSKKRVSSTYRYLFEDFKPYMEECYRRNRFVRILCQGDDDVDILDIYVETFFTHNEQEIKDTELVFSIGDGENHIVTGAGGAGKTFFMRKLWLTLLEEGKRTPLFIELRKLNELSSKSLEAYIRASISGQLEETLFSRFCSEGRFVFILDGFDELPKELHDDVQLQIHNLNEKYHKCGFVVSGRPDGRFAGWSKFKVNDVRPFTLEQTTDLCEKVPFEKESQKIFIKKLNKDFFKKYKSFLSNPLLAVMMMMSFRRNMDISHKMGIFYDDAFGTLFQWHDSTKAFKRKKHLDIQTFRRSFGAFCLLSYAQEKYDFSRTELDELIEKSSDLINLNVNKVDVLDDYERNVNLIRQDGLRYYFIHRSFQEYFAAWALVNVFPHKFSAFSSKIANRPTDNVIKMCYDLQRALVVTDYIQPKLKSLNSKFKFKSKLLQKKIWEKYIPSITITILDEQINQKAPNRYYNLGIRLNIDDELHEFYRNISKLSNDSSSFSAEHDLIDVFISSDIFDHCNRWATSLKVKKLENRTVVQVRPNLDEGTLSITIIRDSKKNVLQTLELLDSELDWFMERGKLFHDKVSACAKWCESEINDIKKSNSTLDEMFFN